MNLEKLKKIENNLDIISKGEFLNLGMVDYKLNQMLVFLESEKFINEMLDNNSISCVLTSKKILPKIQNRIDEKKIGIVLSNYPKKIFYNFHNYLASKTDFYKRDIFPNVSIIDNTALISKEALISPKKVVIGKNVVIEAFVRIYENVIIGDNSVIRSGSTIGGEGFEFKKFGSEVVKVIHAGGVKIGKNVEIQQNCCVDKHIFADDTEIGDNTKFDNFINFAHACKIGKRCFVGANAMIAGSTIIGDDVWIAPSASISSSIKIGNNAFITIGSVVTKNVLNRAHVTGNFAIDHQKFLKFLKTIR